MKFFRIFFLFVLLVAVMESCKQKKKPSLSGDEPVEVNDFIDFFPGKALPFSFNDSLFARKENDSLLISQKVFSQFVPDSVLQSVFGKTAKVKIYPLGKETVSKGETYLLLKAVAPGRKAGFILAFDKKDKFLSAMPAYPSDLAKSLQRSTVIDRRYTITKTVVRKNPDGSSSEGKDIYSFNYDAGKFMLIMTDAIDDQLSEVVNPIDTFTRKNKLSSDYLVGKQNLLSIRDGRKTDRLYFFIHIVKNNGECTGELKGEAMIKSANLAEYRLGGDPCSLQFRFANNSVTVKEIEGCGAHRGLRCSFDGIYLKKKEPKPKIPRKKTAKK